MLTLVIGTPDSGKSALAEKLVCDNSGPEDRYYIATMIPFGEEGQKRIDKHRKLREGKNFCTIEMPFDINLALAKINNPKQSVVLLECISNLVANEMFERYTDTVDIPKIITKQISELATQIADLYIVTNRFDRFETEDKETIEYINVIDRVNFSLQNIADKVIEINDETSKSFCD